MSEGADVSFCEIFSQCAKLAGAYPSFSSSSPSGVPSASFHAVRPLTEQFNT